MAGAVFPKKHERLRLKRGSLGHSLKEEEEESQEEDSVEAQDTVQVIEPEHFSTAREAFPGTRHEEVMLGEDTQVKPMSVVFSQA